MKKQLFLNLSLVLLFGFFTSCGETKPKKQVQQIDYLNESRTDFDKRMKWWRDARFGMFIHWGPYAVPAGIHKGEKVKGIGEWIMLKGNIPIEDYENYSRAFDPTEFDAEKWAEHMKNAGMKYVVITSKHHDGFALWDSKVSDYDIVDYAPYGKDILKALSKACKSRGIKFGLYHSIMDWHHPNAQANDAPRYDYKNNPNPKFLDYYENYLKPQLREIIETYDADILWFDGEWISEFTHEMGLDLYQYVRTLKPDIIINNRVDKGRQGMKGMNKDDKKYAGDFGTPEQEILEGASDLDWESCMTMNDTWGFKSYDENWKSEEVLIHNLIDIAAKGGNYLLNVGPTAAGLIPQPSVERLEKMGEWLEVNGEVIYETEKLKSTYKQGEKIRFTKKKNTDIYYAISLENPGEEFVINHIKPKDGSEIIMLGQAEPLEWNFSVAEGLKIKIPILLLETLNEKTAWSFKIIGQEI